jgi:hypothetical protein
MPRDAVAIQPAEKPGGSRDHARARSQFSQLRQEGRGSGLPALTHTLRNCYNRMTEFLQTECIRVHLSRKRSEGASNSPRKQQQVEHRQDAIFLTVPAGRRQSVRWAL